MAVILYFDQFVNTDTKVNALFFFGADVSTSLCHYIYDKVFIAAETLAEITVSAGQKRSQNFLHGVLLLIM